MSMKPNSRILGPSEVERLRSLMMANEADVIRGSKVSKTTLYRAAAAMPLQHSVFLAVSMYLEGRPT